MSSRSPIAPDQLGAYVTRLPPGPPTSALAHLQQPSTVHPGVVTDPLAVPGGAAGEHAWHDRQRAFRQQLKIRLAGTKLHAGLVVAGLGHGWKTGALNDPSAPTMALAEAVSAYVDRATGWIEATTDALTQQWSASFKPDDREPAEPPGSAANGSHSEPELSDYHRYELARTLVSALQQRPELLDHLEPNPMAALLATPPRSRQTPYGSAEPWVSAGEAADWQWAWSRALARVMETAMDHDFNRELPVLLADARAAIADVIERQIQPFAETFGPTRTLTSNPNPTPERTPEALRMVRMQALALNSRLYAATLARVYDESARTIQDYQDCMSQGDGEGADRIAAAYEERKLGYDGVPHHFQAMVALHEREQAAALQALQAHPASPAAAATPHPTAAKAETPVSPKATRPTRAPGPAQPANG